MRPGASSSVSGQMALRVSGASVRPSGTIGLNYFAPWAQRQGVSSGFLRRMERIATNAGHSGCDLISTVIADDFYLAHGYEDLEGGDASLGEPGFPMRRELRLMHLTGSRARDRR